MAIQAIPAVAPGYLKREADKSEYCAGRYLAESRSAALTALIASLSDAQPPCLTNQSPRTPGTSPIARPSSSPDIAIRRQHISPSPGRLIAGHRRPRRRPPSIAHRRRVARAHRPNIARRAAVHHCRSALHAPSPIRPTPASRQHRHRAASASAAANSIVRLAPIGPALHHIHIALADASLTPAHRRPSLPCARRQSRRRLPAHRPPRRLSSHRPSSHRVVGRPPSHRLHRRSPSSPVARARLSPPAIVIRAHRTYRPVTCRPFGHAIAPARIQPAARRLRAHRRHRRHPPARLPACLARPRPPSPATTHHRPNRSRRRPHRPPPPRQRRPPPPPPPPPAQPNARQHRQPARPIIARPPNHHHHHLALHRRPSPPPPPSTIVDITRQSPTSTPDIHAFIAVAAARPPSPGVVNRCPCAARQHHLGPHHHHHHHHRLLHPHHHHRTPSTSSSSPDHHHRRHQPMPLPFCIATYNTF